MHSCTLRIRSFALQNLMSIFWYVKCEARLHDCSYAIGGQSSKAAATSCSSLRSYAFRPTKLGTSPKMCTRRIRSHAFQFAKHSILTHFCDSIRSYGAQSTKHVLTQRSSAFVIRSDTFQPVGYGATCKKLHIPLRSNAASLPAQNPLVQDRVFIAGRKERRSRDGEWFRREKCLQDEL